CHSGYVGARCEHADLLAVVAASQKKQAITALVVVSIVALAVLIITCVLIHCCQVRKHCEWCRALICRHEKPSALLKGRTACCHSETDWAESLTAQFQELLPLQLNRQDVDLTAQGNLWSEECRGGVLPGGLRQPDEERTS
ncbi:Protransforming growth factor alpha, partial [Camelus dromedarius]